MKLDSYDLDGIVVPAPWATWEPGSDVFTPLGPVRPLDTLEYLILQWPIPTEPLPERTKKRAGAPLAGFLPHVGIPEYAPDADTRDVDTKHF